MAPLGDAGGRLSPAEIEANFADIKPPLDKKRAVVDSARCLFCHDAPCVEACPTGIDIPNFIRMISTPGSARPRSCASAPACATRRKIARSISASCSVTRSIG
jgi:ferredoxin